MCTSLAGGLHVAAAWRPREAEWSRATAKQAAGNLAPKQQQAAAVPEAGHSSGRTIEPSSLERHLEGRREWQHKPASCGCFGMPAAPHLDWRTRQAEGGPVASHDAHGPGGQRENGAASTPPLTTHSVTCDFAACRLTNPLHPSHALPEARSRSAPRRPRPTRRCRRRRCAAVLSVWCAAVLSVWH